MSKNTIKNIVMVVAIILCIALGGGWIAQTVIRNNEEKANAAAVFTVTPQKKSSKLKLSARVLSDDEDVSTFTNAYTITATTSFYGGDIKWSMGWTGETVYWNTAEKTTVVRDCVRLTPINDRSVRVECLQPFGQQIEIIASLAKKPAVTAKCVCDYKQTYSMDELTIGFNTFKRNGSLGRGLINELGIPPASVELNGNQSLSYGCSLTYSSYTQEAPEITSMPELSFSLAPNMEVVEACGLDDYSFMTYTVDFNAFLSGTIDGFFDRSWGEYAVANTNHTLVDFGCDLCNAEGQKGFAIDSVYLYNLTINGLPEGSGSVSYGYRIDIYHLLQVVDDLATLDLDKSNITFGGN